MRPGLAARDDEPPTPTDVDERSLPGGVRAELKGLPKDLGQIVAAHLVAAGELIDLDPDLAYRHAEAARRRAARLPVVREAAAETAYAAGEYAAALNEYRALRRMTGGAEYLPVMADCERALGRPGNALKLAKEAAQAQLDPVQRTEMLLVEAGARDDMGQSAEGMRLLKNAISTFRVPQEAQARLRYAYADMLERHGDANAARQWFLSAGKHDVDEALDAQQRIDALDGLLIEADLDDEDDDPTEEPSTAPRQDDIEGAGAGQDGPARRAAPEEVAAEHDEDAAPAVEADTPVDESHQQESTPDTSAVGSADEHRVAAEVFDAIPEEEK